jgi:thioredoxin:protein disulfide reductase
MTTNPTVALVRVAAFALLAVALATPAARAQQNDVVHIAAPKTVTARQGEAIEVPLTLTVAEGYHVNSNAPTDPYLIGLRLTWNAGPLEAPEISFPKAQTEKFGFSETALSVFAGEFRVVTKFRVAGNAPTGLGIVKGKLRFQACNDRMCLPPKTLDVELPVDVKK